MSGERWIEVTHWDRFQHYRDRNPPWVKNYIQLLHDSNYLSLTGHQRAVLHGLWLEYAASNRQVRAEVRLLTFRLSLKVSLATLAVLESAGFIRIVASRPLASRARSRETEAEAEKSKARQRTGQDMELLGEELEQWIRPGPTPTQKR